MKEQADTSNIVRGQNSSFNYIYEDINGNRVRKSESAEYTYSYYGDNTWEGAGKEQQHAQERANSYGSESGVYWLECSLFLSPNCHVITFDKDIVWEKFKAFYDMLG
jgi:hypothetical protein